MKPVRNLRATGGAFRYVHVTCDEKFLFATNWQTNTAETADTVSAYAIDPKSGALTRLNTASAGGGLPNRVVAWHRHRALCPDRAHTTGDAVIADQAVLI